MSDEHDSLVNRLRGRYPIGPHLPNGDPEFGWRQFEATPINKEAADYIEAQRDAALNLINEVGELRRQLNNARYMLRAYRDMLGPNGLKVAEMWDARGVERVHHEWGPQAAEMTGEERAAFILKMERLNLRLAYSSPASGDNDGDQQ